MSKCDRWTILKIIQVILVIACLVFKRITDKEADRLFLYLQKFSREWSLLNNVTWDKIGSSVADATYGGYTIITVVMLIGKIFGELPTRRRISELTFLIVGAILFIALGSLELAAIDSVPHDLVDNAAILGTVSLVVALLFLIEMGAPKGKKKSLPPASVIAEPVKKMTKDQASETQQQQQQTLPMHQVYDIEQQIDPPSSERSRDETDQRISRIQQQKPTDKREVKKTAKSNGIKKNGSAHKMDMITLTPPPPLKSYTHSEVPYSKGYKQVTNDEDIPRRFGIYGKDVDEYDTDETATLPPKMQLHSPVWSNVRKEIVRKYYIPPPVRPEFIPPLEEEESNGKSFQGGPTDPGYVHFTAHNFGEKRTGMKTPRPSPTDV